MTFLHKAGAFAVAAVVAAPAIAQPVKLDASVLVEKREAAVDGTTRIVLAPAAHVTPGDRVIYRIAYRNTGRDAASDLVIANPVPAGLVYAGPAQGSPEPELSVDGTRFGTLAQLRVAGRPATPADVRVVRWKLGRPVAPGAAGQVAFRATLN